jgi:subtilisin
MARGTKKQATKKSAAKKSVDADYGRGTSADYTEQQTDRKSVIVTFKPKDKRPDEGKDKVEIVESALESSEVTFFDAGMMPVGLSGIPTALPREAIGFDINLYEAPIVVATLSDAEIRTLRNNKNVESVEEDGQFFALDDDNDLGGTRIPRRYQRLEQFRVEGQPSVQSETVPAGVSQIKAPAAWDSTRGKGIRVAVLDTGIDFTHPDIAPNYKGGVSFVPGQTPMDGNSHGTHCAGTIAAAINGAGVIGVAPAASLYAVKVLDNAGSGQWSWLIAGINWCIQNKMMVLSMSLGGDAAPAALGAMCEAAWNNGLLLVAAAGNSGPAMGTVGFPASYPNVIAVSAIDSANVIAPFSSRGPKVELCAPGVNVLSTIPGGGYGTKSGTSMACPHASGVAALAWGSHRWANNVAIRRLLAWTSDNLGVPGRDPLFGYGRVDAEQAAGELAVPPLIPGIP